MNADIIDVTGKVLHLGDKIYYTCYSNEHIYSGTIERMTQSNIYCTNTTNKWLNARIKIVNANERIIKI